MEGKLKKYMLRNKQKYTITQAPPRRVRFAPEFIKKKSIFKKTKRMEPTYYTYGSQTNPMFYDDVRVHTDPRLRQTNERYNRIDPMRAVNSDLYKLHEMKTAKESGEDNTEFDWNAFDPTQKSWHQQQVQEAKRDAIRRWEEENQDEELSKLDKLKMRLNNTKRRMHNLIQRDREIGYPSQFMKGDTSDDEEEDFYDYVRNKAGYYNMMTRKREELALAFQNEQAAFKPETLPYYQDNIPPRWQRWGRNSGN